MRPNLTPNPNPNLDPNPNQVMVQEERESFAAFLTQLCAIIGGVFTVT